MNEPSDISGIQQTIQTLRKFSSDITILMSGSSLPDRTVQFSSDKLFFIEPQAGASSTDFLKALRRAIELSPSSESFFVFTKPGVTTLSQADMRNIARKHIDYFFLSRSGCLVLSKRYASRILESGETPSVKNAVSSGFFAPMSLLQIIRSPKEAMRQYSTIVKFGIVGASGVVVNLLALTIFRIFIGTLVANVIAQELAIINNFVWNDQFTFRSRTTPDSFSARIRLFRFVKYNLVSSVSLAVNQTVFYIAYSHGVYYISSSLIAIATAFVVNYIGSSRWAWASSFARGTAKD